VKCSVCGKETDRLLFGLYCSFRCKPKKVRTKKKNLSTGSKARKARIRLMVKDYSTEEWKRCLEAWEGKCAYCGKQGHMQQEHFLPVDLGGEYTKRNIIPACGKCNSRKKDKDPLEWLLTQDHGLVTYAKVFQYFEALC
jgi:5-methylcytosine-specific restriction endonuclease McrA